MKHETEPILQVNNLVKDYVSRGLLNSKSQVFHAVNNISLELYPGSTYALVGESGSGKSTTGKIICALEKATAGTVTLLGENYTNDSPSQLRKNIRGNIQMVFQDPFSALNPRKTIGDAVIEALQIRDIGSSGRERRNIARDTLQRVGLSVWHMDRYPHQFSGGQLQRVNIARALAVQPKILILDESVSALDVSIQAQVLNLLQEIKEEFSLSYLFITHDLSVVRFIADYVGVLFKGQLVEEGETKEIFEHPENEYTIRLLDSVPRTDPQQRHLLG
ncbi:MULTISPECIES: ATP-binding cassette domain-containing protein [Bifidobacterium]|jgi:ABC-type glutathione transport system ATPase component|uniref:ABC transporter ATP-binding protein n=1 Tax=Bifidobacterium tibiigranuli TaxID=2172043 RepID=A0A5N6S4H0_9BIFI|nr:ATP-binding cassette domain-containing protein [Bifidobacterium tibiigranuli]KAE8128503.1 ABC transporter ATP-binding protein [Bifidobacterium tibiigranuli]KAE8128510.1 peptide ABC transporter ATP-binding protein [Bifidobacterium tibiigranuli]MCI1210694.1 ATP-binding cassette domain-containing protein [Bifidobacterium tibiigranuli]